MDENFLKQNQPAFDDAFADEHFGMYRTDKPFCGVRHVMTIEQSLNKECRKFKQLYTHEGALQKYYITARRKADVTHNMKRSSGFKAYVNDN